MRNYGFGSGGAFHWFFQRISGVILLILLLVHFILTHYFPVGDVTYQKVAVRLSQPGWKLFYMIFLALGLYHGINGIWIIVQDYVARSTWRFFIVGLLMVAGLIFFMLGSITVIPFKV